MELSERIIRYSLKHATIRARKVTITREAVQAALQELGLAQFDVFVQEIPHPAGGALIEDV